MIVSVALNTLYLIQFAVIVTIQQLHVIDIIYWLPKAHHYAI